MLEKSTPSQRGRMSRLAIEVKAGVFVSNINSRVRDKLWTKICDDWSLNAIMIFQTNNEQSYSIRVNGDPDRSVIDFEGIQLLSKPIKKERKSKSKQ
jgi:CRISPR-associated protein Cas2